MLTDRDRARLADVHPVLASAVEKVFAQMELDGTPMFVVSGVRSEAQQQQLYAEGRTIPGPGASPSRPLGSVVTECDGIVKKSDHQAKDDGFGHAVDCAFVPTKALTNAWDARWPWAKFGALAEAAAAGIQWGGKWKTPADLDHVQLA